MVLYDAENYQSISMTYNKLQPESRLTDAPFWTMQVGKFLLYIQMAIPHISMKQQQYEATMEYSKLENIKPW